MPFLRPDEGLQEAKLREQMEHAYAAQAEQQRREKKPIRVIPLTDEEKEEIMAEMGSDRPSKGVRQELANGIVEIGAISEKPPQNQKKPKLHTGQEYLIPELAEFEKEMMADHQPFNSDWTIEADVLKVFSAMPWQSYKQALRELASLRRTLRSYAANMAAQQNRVKQVNLSEPEKWDLLEQVRELTAAYKDAARMFRRHLRHARRLKTMIGDVDAKRRYQLDLEVAVNDVVRAAVVDRLGRGTVQPETWDRLSRLPDDARRMAADKFHRLLNNRVEALKWLMGARAAAPMISTEAEEDED